MSARSTRRGFLRNAAGASVAAMGLPYFVKPSALGLAGAVAASERIVCASIGVGPQGTGVMQNFLGQNDAQVIAACDLKRDARENAKKIIDQRYGNMDCKLYTDFRELCARADVDVLSIATCDHWHVLVALEAARNGKDIYLEKPMGLSLKEDQSLRDVCRRCGTVFQFGTQQRSDNRFRFACELALNERIGKLKQVNVWSPGSSPGGSNKIVPAPDWIDYDFWLGPAPYHPHTENRVSNATWWFCSDYALGFIAGWGVHPLDIALWGGGDKTLTGFEIEGKGVWPEPTGPHDTALNWDLTLKYDSGVVMRYTGDPRPQEWTQRYKNTDSHGTAFEGADGWVQVHRGAITASSDELLKAEWGPNDIRLPHSGNHVRNLLDNVRTRGQTLCNIEAAVQADLLCQVSDIAIRMEQKLRWDAAAERFVDNPTANRRLVRAMRSPWRL